jgi:hypothetical protein
MPKSSCLAFGAKIYYRPIEAAVRWAGLLRFEPRILETLGPRPCRAERLSALADAAVFAERIFDALAHDEMPYGKAGMAQERSAPHSTILLDRAPRRPEGVDVALLPR